MQQKQYPTNNFRNAKPARAKDKPLITCQYGWKRTCTLYNNRIDVDGTSYPLDELVQVRTMYRTVMNVPSLRLELRFRTKDVVLRGIAAIEDAKRIVEYLETYCADSASMPQHVREEAIQEGISTTGRMESIPRVHRENTKDTPSVMLQAQAQATTAPIEAPEWLQNLEQHIIYTRNQQRTKAHRSIRKYGFNVQEVAQEAEADTQPSIAVPFRLLPLETAHYCTEATLSQGIPTSNEQLASLSTALDHGRLVLTSKRVVYIGRGGQVVLDYARLTHVYRLRKAIVFSSDSGSKRYIFEMQRPLECALRLESILRQFQHQRSAAFAPPTYESGLQRTYATHATHATRTTQLRHTAYRRQTASMRPGKFFVESQAPNPQYESDSSHPVGSPPSPYGSDVSHPTHDGSDMVTPHGHLIELEDIETLPLSLLLRHAEVVE